MTRSLSVGLPALLLAIGLILTGCQDASLTAPPADAPPPESTEGAGAPGASRDAACTVTVTSNIQPAVDAAESGDVICVAPGTYDESVVLDVDDLTLRSTDAGTATIVGQSGTAVSIAADGVTVDGLTVTNPGRLLGIKVERDVDGATITGNTVENIGPTGQLGVTGIIVGQGDHDDIEITNNRIQNLDQETTDGSGFPTVNGILFDANNSAPGTITDVTVNNNVIRTLESDVAPLGIVVQHVTDAVSINNNHIYDLVAADETDSDPSDSVDFDFTFAQGINIASPSTANTVINHNVIENITSAETILPEAVKIDGDGSGLKFRANQFLVAIGLNNRNGTDGGSRDPSADPVVDAKNNWWGSRQGPEEADFNQDADDDSRSDVIGNVRYRPFLPNAPGNRGGRPGNPGNGPGSPGNGVGGPPSSGPPSGGPPSGRPGR